MQWSVTVDIRGLAIATAADGAGTSTRNVDRGTFKQEPGAGASAIVNRKRVSVGTKFYVQGKAFLPS